MCNISMVISDPDAMTRCGHHAIGGGTVAHESGHTRQVAKEYQRRFRGGTIFHRDKRVECAVSHRRIAAAPNPVRVGRPLLG